MKNTNKPKYINLSVAWEPDKTLRTPIYRQIVDFISSKVSNGDWIVGEKLPSQRKLAELFGVNRSTIVAAMEELKSYGMIEGDAGGGTRIASNTWSLFMSSPPDWNKYITAGPFKANSPTIQTINRLEFDDRYIRIGTGEIAPSLFPHEMMAKVFRRLPSRIVSLNYLPPLGLDELRKSIANRLALQGIEVSRNSILITSGSLQALQLISVCMLKPGATVFTEAPSYVKSLYVFQSAGMNFSGIPMDKSGIQYWTIEKVYKESLLYTIPTHHNPTGIVMSESRRKDLYDFCSANRLPLVEDDAYGELWFDEKPPKPIKSLDKGGMAIYLGTISKTMAPGLRIGWLVGPESVAERLGDVKMQVDYGASSVSQWALAELLDSGDYDEYLIWLRKQLKARRDNALDVLNEHFSGLAHWQIPSGGFYIWLRLKKPINIETLFSKALENNILFNPGAVYDYAENHCIRISYAYAEPEEFAKAMETLSQILQKL